jgi:hypothetical protein
MFWGEGKLGEKYQCFWEKNINAIPGQAILNLMQSEARGEQNLSDFTILNNLVVLTIDTNIKTNSTELNSNTIKSHTNFINVNEKDKCLSEIIKIKDLFEDIHQNAVNFARKKTFESITVKPVIFEENKNSIFTNKFDENELTPQEILTLFKKGRPIRANTTICRNLNFDLIKQDALKEGAIEARFDRIQKLGTSYCSSKTAIFSEMYADCNAYNQFPDCQFFYKITKKLNEMQREYINEDDIPEIDELLKKVVDAVNKDDRDAMLDLMKALYYVYVVLPELLLKEETELLVKNDL